MDEQMIEPCPFCGGEDTAIVLKGFQGRYRVECCRTVSGPSCGVRTGMYDEKAEAVAAWNTRAAHSVIAGEVAEQAFKDGFVLGFDHRGRTDDPLEAVKGAERDWENRAARAALAPYPERRSE